jgi:UDP-N-acetylglucosamine acyltransferase
MYTSLTQDVPPFVMVAGNPAAAKGINVEGLKRRGFTREQIDAIRAAYKSIYRAGLTLEEAKAALEEQEGSSLEAAAGVRAMREFLGIATRGIVR